MFFGEKPDLSGLKVLGVLLSNTLKRIKTNFPIKPLKKFLLVFLRFTKDTILNSKNTSFSRNVSFDEPSFDYFAAQPSQNIRAFVTEKLAPK